MNRRTTQRYSRIRVFWCIEGDDSCLEGFVGGGLTARLRRVEEGDCEGSSAEGEGLRSVLFWFWIENSRMEEERNEESVVVIKSTEWWL